MVVMPSSSQADIYTYTSLCISQGSAQKHSGNSYGYQHGFFYHYYSPVQLLLNTDSNSLLYIFCHFVAETPLWLVAVWFARYPFFAFSGFLIPTPSARIEAEHPASVISSTTTSKALIFIRVSLLFLFCSASGLKLSQPLCSTVKPLILSFL